MQVVFLGVDYPDYFSGYHRPCLQVPILHPYTFNNELARLLQNELNDVGADFFTEDECDIFEAYIADLRTQPSEWAIEVSAEMVMGDDGNDNDMGTHPYAYFSLGNPHTVSGIQFLD